MRSFKITFYILAVLVLQTVVFARLNLWGGVPDLILVSAIIFCVLLRSASLAIFLAFVSGLFQDFLCFGAYINSFSKVAIASLIALLRENFVASQYFLAMGFVAVFSPLSMLMEAGMLSFFFEKKVIFSQVLLKIFLVSFYNLILFPFLYPIIERLCHDR